MKFADRLKFSSTGTSAATITFGTAITGCRTLAQAITDGALVVGDTNISFTVDDGAGNWEDSLFTITSSTQITRTQVLASSAGGTTAATFTGASLTVYNTVPGAILNRVAIDSDVPFSQSVPLNQVGIAWMAQQTVAAKYTFTPAAGAVKGAIAAGRLIADGTNTPDTTAFKTIAGTATYQNVANAVNLWEASYDGYNYWWAWAQEGSAVSGTGTGTGSTVTGVTVSPSTASVAGSGVQTFAATVAGTNSPSQAVTWATTAGSITSGGVFTAPAATSSAQTITVTATSTQDATKSGTATVTVAAASSTVTGVTVSPSTASVSGGGAQTFTATVSGTNSPAQGVTWTTSAGSITSGGVLTAPAGTASAQTVTVTATSTQDNTKSGTATVTVAAATAPGAPTIGTATAGDTTATVTWAAPASNGGSAITGYTVTATPGGATATAAAGATSATVTGLTDGTAYTFTVHATNSVGNSAESAASNSVTPQAIVWPQLGTLTHVTQSGTGPYDYTGDGTALSTSTNGGLLTKSLAAGVDGYIEAKVITAGDIIFGFRLINSVTGYTGIKDGIYVNTTTYRSMKDGVNSTLSGFSVQAGDIMRVTRVGTLHKLQLARAATPTTFTDMDSYDYGSSPIMYMQACVFGSSVLRLTGMGGFA